MRIFFIALVVSLSTFSFAGEIENASSPDRIAVLAKQMKEIMEKIDTDSQVRSLREPAPEGEYHYHGRLPIQTDSAHSD
jgi:hypothetical protein